MAKRKVAMIGATIATTILTESRCCSKPALPSVLRTRFSPFNVLYNIYKGEFSFPGCRLAMKATSRFQLSRNYSYGPQEPEASNMYGPSVGASAPLPFATVMVAIPEAFTAVIV